MQPHKPNRHHNPNHHKALIPKNKIRNLNFAKAICIK